MRARIDNTEIETQTKIRAKYLRALENEEWDLLPGPTYVKSFLRTYADALDLDGKRLVEEYKLQHERLSDVELQPIVSRGNRERPHRRGLGGSRLGLIGAAVIVLVGALYLVGRGGGGAGDTPVATVTTTSREPAGTTPSRSHRRHRRAASRIVRLQVIPTAPVYVCLEKLDGTKLIDGQILNPGTRSSTYRSKRFEIGLGNGSVKLRVDGKTFDVPPSSDPIGYRITARGRTSLPSGRRPTCG
jgi:hypothetical protein